MKEGLTSTSLTTMKGLIPIVSLLKDKTQNAIGRKVRVKYLYGPENIIVYYDNNDNIKHISLQNKDLAQKALMRYFDRMHDRSWWHHRRPR